MTLIFVFCFYCFGLSQTGGIHFENGLSWKMILAKANKEHKFILVDCYTSWCGPCKYMANNIFPLKEVGDSINSRFISVSMQLDTSSRDSDTNKKRYADAHFINTKYEIIAYPTFLYFDFNGKLVHRTTGANEAPKFIGNAMDALDPGTQYYTMLDSYRAGGRDTLFLESLYRLAETNMEKELQDSILKDWFAQIKDPFIKGRPEMISEITKSSSDRGFGIFYKDAKRVDELVRPEFAEQVVENIIIQENDAIQRLFKSKGEIQDWDIIHRDIAGKYSSEYADRVLDWVKVAYYKKEKTWSLYGSSVANFVIKYGCYQQDIVLNNYAWDIFQYCDKKEDLMTGINCIKRVLDSDLKQHAAYKDTYANLLYKIGKTDEAIAVETEAMNQAETDRKRPYQQTIDKMKAGVKTWD